MKFVYAFAFLLVAVAAQEYHVYPPTGEIFLKHQVQEDPMHPHVIIDSYPEWYVHSSNERQRRDVTWDRKIGDGKVFGTLGEGDAGLYGKAGYQRNIFNDERGKLDGQVYGSHVLGVSSHLGGGLNWKDDHAKASLDLNRQIGGPTSLSAAGGGRWPVGKSGGEFSAQGTYGTTFHGRPDYGVRFGLNYPW